MVILQGCVYKIEEVIEFVAQNGLKSQKVQTMMDELQNVVLKKVKYALCKCMAKHLSNKNQAKGPEPAQIKEQAPASGSALGTKQVKFDNVFDMVFNSNSMLPKQEVSKQVLLQDSSSDKARLNFLGHDDTLKISAKSEDAEDFDLSKVKLSKQFKLINPLPKMRSVPATPEFFDLAGAYITYTSNGVDPEVEAKKYEV